MDGESTISPLNLFQDSSNKKSRDFGVLSYVQTGLAVFHLVLARGNHWGDPGCLHSFPARIHPHPHPLESSLSSLSFFSTPKMLQSLFQTLSSKSTDFLALGSPELDPALQTWPQQWGAHGFSENYPDLPDFNNKLWKVPTLIYPMAVTVLKLSYEENINILFKTWWDWQFWNN